MWKKGLVAVFVWLFVQGAVCAEMQNNSTGNTSTVGDLLVPGLSSFPLPEKFSQLDSSSVVPVRLPLGRLRRMRVGEMVTVTLPNENRQFTVVHDEDYPHEDGYVTWVGYIQEAGESCRVMITFGRRGDVFGSMCTPVGAFTMETLRRKVYLIKTTGKVVMDRDDQVLAGIIPPASDVSGAPAPVVEIPLTDMSSARVNNMIARAKQFKKDHPQAGTSLIIRVAGK